MELRPMGQVRISLRNLILALKDQLPLSRAFRNFLITGQAWGLFSVNSHISLTSGKPKVLWPNPGSARKECKRLEKSHGGTFSVYKCAFCDGYHIGRSRTRSEAKQRITLTLTKDANK